MARAPVAARSEELAPGATGAVAAMAAMARAALPQAARALAATAAAVAATVVRCQPPTSTDLAEKDGVRHVCSSFSAEAKAIAMHVFRMQTFLSIKAGYMHAGLVLLA